VTELHRRWPEVTYDVTIKIEHLLLHQQHLGMLARTGCVFVTSAVESVDDRVLEALDKGHTTEDFIAAAVLMKRVGLRLNPTFIAFTPWTTLDGYRHLLDVLSRLELIPHVSPIQYAIRLLIPEGSLLLDLPEVADLIRPFDERGLVYPWRHPDATVDALYERVRAAVGDGTGDRLAAFEAVCDAAGHIPEREPRQRITVPYLTEPWYC
jgi:radical SAM superfamily enzyme YgiQ (UPF0313 family)